MKQLHNRPAAASPRSRPGLERLFELAVLLTDGMERGLTERGLTRARAELLWQLAARRSMTQRELADALNCTPRNVTDLVDALEAGGLVARGTHPTDRRATLVSLTKQGAAVAARLQAEYVSFGSLIFADVSERELAVFLAVVDRTIARIRAGSEERRAGDASPSQRGR